MRILVLTDRLPFPLANGQNLRVFNLATHLRKRHTLYLAAYGYRPYPREVLALFDEIATLDEKPRPTRGATQGWRLWRAFSPDDLFVFDPEMLGLIRGVLDRIPCDAVWICGWDMLVYAPRLRGVPLLADVVDEGVLEHLRALRHGTGTWQRLVAAKRLLQNYLFERRYFGEASLCTVVSEVDAAVLRRVCPAVPVAVVHNGVDVEHFARLGLPEDEETLVFEGHMRFAPNVDAVVYFWRSILPLVRRRRPGVKFRIVGKESTPAVQALADDGVTVTGYVDDVRPHLDRASVFVCPMRKGAGIKNKILQAWAMAKPVVATRESCGGLPVLNGENILIADGPTEFAEAVLWLLADRSRREALGRAGRETVCRRYTWSQKAWDLEAALSESIRTAQRRTDPVCATMRF